MYMHLNRYVILGSILIFSGLSPVWSMDRNGEEPQRRATPRTYSGLTLMDATEILQRIGNNSHVLQSERDADGNPTGLWKLVPLNNREVLDAERGPISANFAPPQ